MSAFDRQVGGSHYMNGKIQLGHYVKENQLGFYEASVLKRITRHNKIGGKGQQDIEKAIHELQLLLELYYEPTTIAGPAQGPIASRGGKPSWLCPDCYSHPCVCIKTAVDPYGGGRL